MANTEMRERTGMHGEYKVPGGKLVVVDFDVVDGKLANVRLAGDFFLEPDEALDDLNAGLEGMLVTSTAEDITREARAALPEGAELLGFSPEAIAVVVRRAITGARDWREYDWQVLYPESMAPRVHVALDQVLTEEVGAGRRPPTLRIWRWEDDAAVLGSFQSVKNEIDPEAAEAEGVEVVRRISGGGAMFMEAGSVITYSLYVPSELVSGMSFAESYAYLDEWVLLGLNDLGIEAVYEPLNDITSPKGKIGGAAQKRLSSGAVLHHATLSYDIDADRMLRVLRIGREKMSDKGTKSAKKRVSPLKTQTGMAREDIIQSLIEKFVHLYDGTRGELKPEEIERARELAESKFASREWIHRVP